MPAGAVRTVEASPYTQYVRARVADAAGNPELAASQYAAALAVAKLVEEGVITEDVGNSLAGIVVQQFHHWELKMEDAEQILYEQYTGARAAILKAFAGGGSLEDTKSNAGHVHELVSNAAFGNIDPARIPAILKGECKPIEPKAA